MKTYFYKHFIVLTAFLATSIAVLAGTPDNTTGRPDHVNNALKKYFPPIIQQSGGSCGSAANIYYQMSYELCSFRDLDASVSSNRLPTHFTWLHTNSKADKETIAIYHGVPSVATYGGDTYSSIFGEQDCSDKDFGWMQGYDKWYSAMFNRLERRDDKIPHDLMTEEGREELKNYLWNHWGDTDYYGGGVVGIGVASAVKCNTIASTPANQEAGVVGMNYLYSWGSQVDHALTIVGYDDRIEFDLDNNGVYGEESKDEKGAWIIANSWGTYWRNNGFIYCPYKFSYSVGTSSNVLRPNHHVIRKNYKPKKVLKIKMDYSHRSELCLSALVLADTTEIKPDVLKFEKMPFFNYAGDGTNASAAPEVPMLGKWQYDMHSEPMEFGYDVTDLADKLDPTEPQRFFFLVSTKGNLGKGNIYNVSLMDYSMDERGMELPARVDSVIPLQATKSALVYITIQGNQIYPPMCPMLNGTTLTWQEPKQSSFTIKSYNIYKDGVKVGTANNNSTLYTVKDPDASYCVTAVYNFKNETKESLKSSIAHQTAYTPSEDTDNYVLNMNNGSFTAPGVLNASLKNATIEFWIKPSRIALNQTIGSNWGSGFTIQCNEKGQLMAGWSTSDRMITSNTVLKKGTWAHVAITVEGSAITLYINGLKRTRYVSTSNEGIPALGDLVVGNTEGGAIEGLIDELRVWNTCRTLSQIYYGKTLTVVNPAIHSDLLCYCKMDAADGVMKDYASGNSISIDNNSSVAIDNTILTGPAQNFTAEIQAEQSQVYANVPVRIQNLTMINVVSNEWTAEGATPSTSNNDMPYFTFPKEGEYTITLVATSNEGDKDTVSTTIEVLPVALPKADFVFSADTVSAGDAVTLANYSTGSNATFTWLAPGSDQGEYHGVNGLLTYPAEGKYDVTLIASNSSGEDRVTKSIYVMASPPACDLDVYPNFIYLGETAYLNDLSKYDPTYWKWELTNGYHGYLVEGQNSSLTPKHTGVYDVTLNIGNENGASSKTIKNALTVCNENSYSGLRFTGSEYLETTSSPFATETDEFTIEWWMKPGRTEGALSMYTNAFNFYSDDNGRIIMTMGTDNYYKTAASIMIANAWHHYAVTYKKGTVNYYRDGKLAFAVPIKFGDTCPAWGNLNIGRADGTYFRGMVDEFRVWDKALSESEIAAGANCSIKNVEDATNNKGLVLYYDFNQNGGDVIDRTTHGINSTRNNFGPDGDAWGYSLGVFSLDLETSGTGDVSSQYLTNYKAPFLYDITTVNSTNSSTLKKLLQNTTTSKWKLENTINNYNRITGAHVDRSDGDVLAVTTSYNFFNYEIYNHLCYQTVSLPQGVYTLTVEPGNYYEPNTSVLLANKGSQLCTNSTYKDEALAYTDLRNNTIKFFVDKPSTVSLGFIFNMPGQQRVQIKSIKLEKSGLEVLEADGLTNVYDAVEATPEKWATGTKGYILLACKEGRNVKIYTLDGKCVFNNEVEGVHYIPMPAGIYIVNGQKVIVD